MMNMNFVYGAMRVGQKWNGTRGDRGRVEQRGSEFPKVRLLVTQPGRIILLERGGVLEAECQCIDVVVIVTGRSLDELWCFGDDGVVGLQRHACVNLISVVVAMDGEEDHIPRAHFLGRSTTLMSSTSVSSFT